METETNISDQVPIENSSHIEVSAFSAERNHHDTTAFINTRVDIREREGAKRIESSRLSRAARGCEHDHCPEGQACQCEAIDVSANHDHHQGGGGEHRSRHHHHDISTEPPAAEGIDNWVQLQPSSMNLHVYDPPAQCADVTVCSSDVALQTTNLGQFNSLHIAASMHVSIKSDSSIYVHDCTCTFISQFQDEPCTYTL